MGNTVQSNYFTNIGGIKFVTEDIDFENTKQDTDIVTVTLKDGSVYTFSKEQQQRYMDKLGVKAKKISPCVWSQAGKEYEEVTIPNRACIFNCNFTHIKGANESTEYEFSNVKVYMDVKNNQQDIIYGGENSSIRFLIQDNEDKKLYF